ncbi:hypothetical protein N0V94_000840 [Neodidymelliopsis sp. IMI 364377]|nr:hypothetical protein N0V94_000840 [Neodidymelliopsis sp. IMI 364377]
MAAPHGKKRPAEGSLDGEQRLSKRFDLLNLDNTNEGARLYIPIASSSDPPTTSTPTPTPTTPHPLVSHVSSTARQQAPRPPPSDDAMHVEDTPHRVYIADLAAELSDIESDSDTPIYLSDIEKHLSKIPRHVLLGPPPKPTKHNQVVLYNVPTSLSVPEEQDNVRKAIVEARQRIRNSQASAVTEPERVLGLPTQAPAVRGDEQDADAMDID